MRSNRIGGIIRSGVYRNFFFFFFALVTGPSRSLSFKLKPGFLPNSNKHFFALIPGVLHVEGVQPPMAQGRSTKIISMITWIRTSRLSIKIDSGEGESSRLTQERERVLY